MKIKAVLVAVACMVSPALYAGNVYPLTKAPLVIHPKCEIKVTDNPLDIALMNSGYFVVSNGKANSELLFTRLGRLFLDMNYYLRTQNNDYLLAVTKNSDAKNLKKIKISVAPLAPKATSMVKIVMNLSANTMENDAYIISTALMDSLSNQHVVNIRLIKENGNIWKAHVLVDDVERGVGTLRFDTTGTLYKQEGLDNILWPAEYGMHDLKIDFKSSTQYAMPFQIQFMKSNGYPLGQLLGIQVTNNGEIGLIYSNGQFKLLKNRIAVSQFTNPSFLEPVMGDLYRANEKSGQPRIHWLNGERSVLSGALEEVACVV